MVKFPRWLIIQDGSSTFTAVVAHGLVKPSTTPAIDLGFSHRSIQTRAFAFENTFLIESKDLFANTIDGAERD